jgi:putative ABC transport system substrate-binding protein
VTPDVLLASGLPATAALKKLTAKIPIVFALGGDPVVSGIVASLARPGGNVTGFPVNEPPIAGKWLRVSNQLEIARTSVTWGV